MFLNLNKIDRSQEMFACIDLHVRLQDWPTGEGLLPSVKFNHIEGDAMDKKVLDKAKVSKADAIIMGVAHDTNPKDVSALTVLTDNPPPPSPPDPLLNTPYLSAHLLLLPVNMAADASDPFVHLPHCEQLCRPGKACKPRVRH